MLGDGIKGWGLEVEWYVFWECAVYDVMDPVERLLQRGSAAKSEAKRLKIASELQAFGEGIAQL